MEDEDRTVMLTEAENNVVKTPVEQERLTKLLDMAFWHKQVGNTKSAILACEAAIVINKDSITAHSLLGSLYEKQGDTQKAITHMERVVALNPNNPMDQARLDQLRHDALQQTVTGGGLVNMIAARSATARDEIRDGSQNNKLLPALIAVAVVAGVVTIGLYAVHKPATRVASDAVPQQVRPGPGPGFGVVTPPRPSGPRMSMGSSPNSVVDMPKAALLPPAPDTTHVAANPSADPFAFGAPAANSAPVELVKPADNHGETSDKVKILPPISIGGSSSADLAPAPITVSNTPGTSVTPLPQHTVVVQQLPNEPTNAPSSYQTPAAAPYDPSVVVPHIHISVDKDNGSGATPTSDRTNAIVLGGPQSGGNADSLQSEALVLQQQGDYAKAAEAYTKAIHLYTSQIASGHDVETARRALQSCQTGLKICQASQ